MLQHRHAAVEILGPPETADASRTGNSVLPIVASFSEFGQDLIQQIIECVNHVRAAGSTCRCCMLQEPMSSAPSATTLVRRRLLNRTHRSPEIARWSVSTTPFNAISISSRCRRLTMRIDRLETTCPRWCPQPWRQRSRWRLSGAVTWLPRADPLPRLHQTKFSAPRFGSTSASRRASPTTLVTSWASATWWSVSNSALPFLESSGYLMETASKPGTDNIPCHWLDLTTTGRLHGFC